MNSEMINSLVFSHYVGGNHCNSVREQPRDRSACLLSCLLHGAQPHSPVKTSVKRCSLFKETKTTFENVLKWKVNNFLHKMRAVLFSHT